MANRSVWIGFDPREAEAYAVARFTAERALLTPVPIHGIVLPDLIRQGLYNRPTSRVHVDKGKSQLYDDISNAPMSTEFAISRFLTVYLARELFMKRRDDKGPGWALFMDADVLCLKSLEPLFEQADPNCAVMVVKHNFNPPEGVKMDGQAQTRYARKNWSSVMLFNLDHPANDSLTVEMVNTLPGRDLHRFCWLDDSEIGELDPKWNFLVGHHSTSDVPDPHIVHFTDGIPSMSGYEDCDFADQWRMALQSWAR